jgi:U4/U6 small nuclear ribonucleoprotein PRP31
VGCSTTSPSEFFSASLRELMTRVRTADSRSDEPVLLPECVAAVAALRAYAADTLARLATAYSPRFPELRALLPAPREFARAVHALRNDLTHADALADFLSTGTVITIQVAASASAGRLLSESELLEVDKLAEQLLEYEEAETLALAYVESRACTLAPNLTAVVGGAVAAQLVGEAGGLESLSRIPGCNIKVLGKVHRDLQGRSTAHAGRHEGVVFSCPLVLSLPPSLRKKGADMVANKAVLAARVDAAKEHRDGGMGASLRADIAAKFEKWQEPPPARTAKPLPVPDEVRKKHRAGKRARRNKELYGVSEMRKQANRVKFGQAEEHYGNDIESNGLGMLGVEGSGKLRVLPKKSNSVLLAANRRLQKHARGPGPSAAVAAGLTTTVDGLELGAMTPAPGGVGLGSLDSRDGTQSNYFSSATPFRDGREK